MTTGVWVLIEHDMDENSSRVVEVFAAKDVKAGLEQMRLLLGSALMIDLLHLEFHQDWVGEGHVPDFPDRITIYTVSTRNDDGEEIVWKLRLWEVTET